MKWWSRFLKKRRQSDRVKIMFFFFLVGIGFLGNFIYRGILINQTVNRPVEYVLTNPLGKITDVQIGEIKNLDSVKAVSRQRETAVTLKNQGEEVSIACVQLSADYLKLVYGIQKSGSMKTFYLNQAAWEQLFGAEGKQLSETEGKLQSGDAEMGLAEFVLQEEGGDAEGGKPESGKTESGTAKVVLLASAGTEERACAYCEGNSVTLSGGTDAIRVQVGGQKLDGTSLEPFNQLGFEAADAGSVQQAALEQEMQFLQMKYSILIAVLCFLFVGCMKKSAG